MKTANFLLCNTLLPPSTRSWGLCVIIV
uniref:Uncharacterized protein n=1 Tax=Arundo donax TaxID=35708 RepID=A0A0A8YXH7_ARUDO